MSLVQLLLRPVYLRSRLATLRSTLIECDDFWRHATNLTLHIGQDMDVPCCKTSQYGPINALCCLSKLLSLVFSNASGNHISQAINCIEIISKGTQLHWCFLCRPSRWLRKLESLHTSSRKIYKDSWYRCYNIYGAILYHMHFVFVRLHRWEVLCDGVQEPESTDLLQLIRSHYHRRT